MNEELTAYVSAFVDELVRSGVRDIVISPGSRSTPIAILAAEHPQMNVRVIVDERSAGYFALGLAKAKRGAVALLCTSGTAAANYMPAVAEAYLARVPLVVLTADRPHELRDVGAPQTIQQIGLFGGHAKWFAEMPIPESSAQMLRHARMTASRAAAVAVSHPRGPVHLNFPLREPLLPDLLSPGLWAGGREEGTAYTAVTEGAKLPAPAALRSLAAKLSQTANGIIVCGPQDEPGFAEAVTGLAEVLQYPVLADPLSQLRSGSHSLEYVIDSYDAFLRDESAITLLQPEVIIRFGAMPVSKALLQYIHRYPQARMIVVEEGDGWRDPTLLAAELMNADPSELCRALTVCVNEAVPKRNAFHAGWARRWRRINAETRRLLREESRRYDELFEGRLFVELEDLLPERSTLFVGNSMPIRDLDTFFGNNPRYVRVMGNRGANGIDGIVSSALGASIGSEHTVLVIGDLSFYHDMNGLLAAKLHGLNMTVILVNNDGGGIFSFLSQAQLPEERFEQLFGTPIGLDYEIAVRLYDGAFTRVHHWEDFREALGRSFTEGGLQVIELPTDRDSNVAMHRGIWDKLFSRLSALL